MRTASTARLNVLSLESRLQPSATAALPAEGLPPARVALPAPAAAPAVARPLSGWLAGQARAVVAPPIVDAGLAYTLSGRASLAGLGAVTVEGRLRGVGFLATGHALGTLTLTKIGDPASRVTLELTGPEQPGFSQLPAQWSARATHGTGTFAHVGGTATFTLLLDVDAARPNTGVFHARM
jgi:hypothetical protein